MASQPSTSALAIAVAVGVPVLLWGGPGTGKSSVVQSLAKATNRHCEVVIASIREPSDFAGLPIVTNGTVRFAPPSWAENLASCPPGLLFLDELSTAPPAVQAALLRVVLERTVGELALPPEVSVVAAANPPEQAADGWDLSAPLANRFCHIEWTIDAPTVAAGLTSGFSPPTIPALSPNWERYEQQSRSDIATFLSLRPSLLSAPPTQRSAAGRAWPSPRSWEMAARLLGASRSVDADLEVQSVLVCGCVGVGPGLELMGWLSDLDLPNPEALLADPDHCELPDRGDRLWATLTAVATAVAADNTPERWAAGWRVLGRSAQVAPDVGALAARILARCRPDGAPTPEQAAKFLPLLKAAKLL